MSQDTQDPCDRDCLIAATLATGGVEGQQSGTYMFKRFVAILRAIQKAGGSHQVWLDSQHPEVKAPPTTTE